MAKRPQTLVFRRASLLGQGPGLYAVVVEGGKVGCVGPDAGLPAMTAARVIDCAGATLLPGLHDHHIHLPAYAASLRQVDCGPH
ncbi:MAG: hypothetical protein HY681_15210, partial [Chloroflexi bacterium]|nr:hypothetical protein [Chloroflexota bacterium]